MEHLNRIQHSLDYIEDNLTTEIPAEELANMAGFSLYHYYRLFQTATGMPVMQYILRRRLLHGIYQISQGAGKTQTAFDYGFDTYAGFYKAFRREFSCTPTAYLDAGRAKAPRRPNLRKEEHMIVTHKRAAAVLKNWPLTDPSIRDIYYDGTGNRNEHAYYVGDGYVLKFTEDLPKLQKHIALCRSLFSAGIDAAIPLATISGEDYVQDGRYWFYLTRRLTGTQVFASDLYDVDAGGKARFIGEILGQLHRILKDADHPVRDADLADTVRSWAYPKASACLKLPEEKLGSLVDRLCVLYPRLPRHIIHRDPNPGNIILSEDQWGFIDFDLSERNARIFDPCYAATAILSETYRDGAPDILDQWLMIYRDLIFGYDSVCKLTEDEWEALPYMILANQLVCVAWFAENEEYAALLDTNVKMTRWLIENFHRLQIE